MTFKSIFKPKYYSWQFPNIPVLTIPIFYVSISYWKLFIGFLRDWFSSNPFPDQVTSTTSGNYVLVSYANTFLMFVLFSTKLHPVLDKSVFVVLWYHMHGSYQILKLSYIVSLRDKFLFNTLLNMWCQCYLNI